MIKKSKILIVILFITSRIVIAQSKILKGIITASDDVEGITVFNKTALKFDVTDAKGHFEVFVKLNDTLIISALKYKEKTIVINSGNFNKNTIQIFLEEKINELDEVIVGKVLTGSLGSDIGNVELKEELNFYDLGIPGYTGKPKTMEERKLYDADHGKLFVYYGIGFAVNINKLLNTVSGRTKKLKKIVELSENDKCIKRLRDFYGESLFNDEDFTEAQQLEYFYFCADDNNFKTICERKDPTETQTFLDRKLIAYKANIGNIKN